MKELDEQQKQCGIQITRAINLEEERWSNEKSKYVKKVSELNETISGLQMEQHNDLISAAITTCIIFFLCAIFCTINVHYYFFNIKRIERKSKLQLAKNIET